MTVWEWLGRIDVLFGMFATLFSGFAALKLWQQNKRLRELVKTTPHIENFTERVAYFSGVQTDKPMAFALSLIPHGGSIKSSVHTFLKSKNMKMEIEELNMNGINTQEDREFFLNELRRKRRIFDELHVTELHLFIAGPVIAGVLIGAIFDNWIPVKLYHRPQVQTPAVYEYWMPLIK